MTKIGYKDLKRARIKLRKDASEEFPKLSGFDSGKVAIAARLRVLDIDPDGCMQFARDLIDRDRGAITIVYGPFWKHQLSVVHAAITAGIAIGVQAERMANG